MVGSVEAFNEYKKQRIEEVLVKRNSRLLKVNNKESATAWIKEVKAWFQKSVGPLVIIENPKKEYFGFVQAKGFKIEKWLFEVFPGTFASSNLYVPDKINSSGVSIVAPIGHWSDGKINPDYQNMGAYMASHGVPVLIYDHAGLGERKEFWDPIKQESLPGKSPTTEHCRMGDMLTAVGIQPANFFLSEARQAITFLKSFDFINPNKIGISGASGGGSISREAACYFDDLAFSIPVCILRKETVGGDSCHEQIIWGEGVEGVAAIDNLICMAPKPVMVVSEFIDCGLESSYATLRRIYDLMGAPEKVTEYFRIHDVHGYTHPMIEAVYRFLKNNFDLTDANYNVWQNIKNYNNTELNITKSGFLNRERFQISMRQQALNQCRKSGDITENNLRKILGIDQLAKVECPSTSECFAVMRVGSCLKEEVGKIGLIDWEPSQVGWFHGYGDVYNCAEAGAGRWALSFGCSIMGYRVQEIVSYVKKHGNSIKVLQASHKWCLPLLLACAIHKSNGFPKIELQYLLSSYRTAVLEDLNVLYSANYIPVILQYGDIDDILKFCGDAVNVKYRTDSFGRVVQ